MRKLLLGVAVVAVFAAACTQTTEAEPIDGGSYEVTESVDVNLEAARIAWDTAITSEERAAICDFYNTPPVGITPELVEIFDEGAGLGYAEAERVLSTLLAEEC